MYMKYLFVICLVALGLKTHAQDRAITGILLDKTTQQPIENANITLKGTTSGAVSDSLGVFKIILKSNIKSLVISHVNYQTVLIQIPEKDKFKIKLDKIYVVLPKVVLNLQPPALAPFDTTYKERERIANREVEQNASFYGGTEYLNHFLSTNYKYPEGYDLLLSGETYVSFEVGITGSVDSVKIQDDLLNIAMKNQIIKTFSSMPDWQPAYQRGKSVAQKLLVPTVYGPLSKSDESITYLNYYLAKSITYPVEAIRLAVEGTVFVYFALNSEQDFTRLEVIQGIGSDCDKMVYSAVKSIPKAELKNLMIELGDSVFVLPVDFHLDPTSIREDILINSTDAVFLLPIEVLAYKPTNYLGRQYATIYNPASEFYSVEGALKHINNATKLRITDQQLSLLSPDVGKLINLRLLDLENNNLQALPKELADLPFLEEVYASRNKLSSLPMGVSNMARLKIVDLAKNDFTEFPVELLRLKKLRLLDLSNNKISLIPSEIGNLKNLKTLLLRNNNIQDLPEEFFKLNLKEIDFEGNSFSEELKQKIKESFKNAKITL